MTHYEITLPLVIFLLLERESLSSLIWYLLIISTLILFVFNLYFGHVNSYYTSKVGSQAIKAG